MLISKEVEILLHSSNISYYESKGYEIPRRKDKVGRLKVAKDTKIIVKIEDVPLGSSIDVTAQCDYCMEDKIITQYTTNYYNYNRSRKIIEKDCCNNVECMKRKREESLIKTYNVNHMSKIKEVKDKNKEIMLKKYGVENISKTEYFKQKYKETMLENYGVEHYSQTEEFKIKSKETQLVRYGVENYSSTKECREKVINTCIENYGVIHPAKTKVFQDKREKTMLDKYGVKAVIQISERKYEMNRKKEETNLKKYGSVSPLGNKLVQEKIRFSMYRNNTAPCSKQQKYLCDLLNCKLNYPFANFSLDMVFLNEKIYIEYDGSGHDLQIKYKNIDEKTFKIKEMRRQYFLYNRGWRSIRIISEQKDLLPRDNIVLKLINKSKEYLNTGHSWIEYNIDEGKVKCSQYEKDYDFGELRKIHKENIKIS